MKKYEAIDFLKAMNHHVEPDQEHVLDMFRPEDALGVARLYFKVYGDAFPVDYVYFPDKIIERFTSGEHHAIVARTTKGDIVGIMGVFNLPPNKNLYEIGQLIVLPEYRKSGLAMSLNAYAIKTVCPDINARAIFGEAVCNHMASQTLSAYFGMKETGLEIEPMPSEAFFGDNASKGRVSLLLVFLVFDDAPHQVYFPDVYREFGSTTYRALNLEREFVRNPNIPLPEKSVIHSQYMASARVLKVTVEKTGRDFKEKFASVLGTCGSDSIIHAVFNLSDAHVPDVVSALREEGFFLGGILPLWFGTDGFMMQRHPGKPDFSAINLYYPRAKEILQDVMKDFMETAGLSEQT